MVVHPVYMAMIRKNSSFFSKKNWPTHHISNDYYKQKQTDLHITNNKQIWFPLKTKFNIFEGLYSRRKSHTLCLAVPIQCIIEFCNSTEKETETPENSSSEDDEESQRAHETEHSSLLYFITYFITLLYENTVHQHSMMRKASQTLLWQQKQLMWHVPLWNHALLRFECRVSFEKISLMILVYLSNILFLFVHHDIFLVTILYFMSLRIKSQAF